MKTLSALTVALLLATTLAIFNTPCATEDTTLCYWNGDTRGNKSGISFIALTDTISIRTK